MSLLPPTSFLPSIRTIPITSEEDVTQSLEYLRRLYNPPVRGSHRQGRKQNPHKLTAEGASEIQQDPFERLYVIQWLTSLLKLAHGPPGANQIPEAVIANASSLLSNLAGTASAVVVERQFVFERSDGRDAIVDIMDVPLDNQDYSSVGAQTWGGACLLSEMIVEEPDRFGLETMHASDRRLRVLELGAGTGLVGLTIFKLLDTYRSSRTAEILLTDFYPDVLRNLQSNIERNLPSSRRGDCTVLSCALDWSSFSEKGTSGTSMEEPFDLVFGADIIYEARHAEWVKNCLEILLRKPDQNSDVDHAFHLLIPLRRTHAVESFTIEKVFPTQNLTPSQNGTVQLVIKSKETIVCDAEPGRDVDEIDYAYYKISWNIQ